MKKLLMLLILVSMISGCGNTKEPIVTGEVVAPVIPVAEPPKEEVKSYEFSILETETYVNELCSITSRIKNVDVVTHRYHVDSYVIINGAKEGIGEDFNLASEEVRVVSREVKCLGGTEDTLNAEATQVK